MDSNEDLQVYLVRSNELYHELAQRRAWNRTVGESMKGNKAYSFTIAARQHIRTQVERNHRRVDEIRILVGDAFA